MSFLTERFIINFRHLEVFQKARQYKRFWVFKHWKKSTPIWIFIVRYLYKIKCFETIELHPKLVWSNAEPFGREMNTWNFFTFVLANNINAYIFFYLDNGLQMLRWSWGTSKYSPIPGFPECGSTSRKLNFIAVTNVELVSMNVIIFMGIKSVSFKNLSWIFCSCGDPITIFNSFYEHKKKIFNNATCD